MSDSFEEVETEWKPPTEGEMKVMEARRERSDRISKLMGEYLLKGYKMLGTTCPECGNILMRDRQQVDYCVACRELACDVSKDDPALDTRAMRQMAAEQQRRGLMGEDTSHPADSAQISEQLPNACCAMVEGDSGAAQPEVTSSCVGALGMPLDGGDRAESGLTAMPLLRSYGGLPSSIWSNTDHIGHRRPVKPEPTNRLNVGSVFPEVASAFTGWKQQQQTADTSDAGEIVQSKLTWAAEQLRRTPSIEYSIQLCQLIKSCAETTVALKNMQERCIKITDSTQM